MTLDEKVALVNSNNVNASVMLSDANGEACTIDLVRLINELSESRKEAA